ncbi:response regulator [bacterium]|nr:response regulator [bacterium]
MAKSILIVDDEEIIRNVLRRKLEQTTSYKVFTADDGVVALDMFKEQPVDLVISDLLMKEMNGIELLRNLKSIEPSIPVIIITGYGTLDDAIEAIHLGAEDFIKKPFDINEVLETIDKTFRKLAEEADQREVIKYIAHEDIKLEIPNQFDLLNTVINYIFSHLRARWLVSDEDLHDVKVCLYEALTNAFEHGNLGISGEVKTKYLEKGQQHWRDYLLEQMEDLVNAKKAIHVNLTINEELMRVAIQDEGPGFDYRSRTQDVDPEELFRSSGRGLLLIQSLMDAVEFNDSGNEVTMTKYRESS